MDWQDTSGKELAECNEKRDAIGYDPRGKLGSNAIRHEKMKQGCGRHENPKLLIPTT